jgi:hypothetical protein
MDDMQPTNEQRGAFCAGDRKITETENRLADGLLAKLADRQLQV